MDLSQRKQKLRERFPAAEDHVLSHAARSPTINDALNYLRAVYGNPTGAPSAWSKPLDLSAPPPANPALQRARERALEGPKEPLFKVDNYKIKECKSRAGCTCDKYHHEYERRRDPNKVRYSEIPCPQVYRGSWNNPSLCPRGNACGHSHTVNESSYHPRIYKTKRCQKFEEGKCQYGTRCAYIHGNYDKVAFEWRERKNKPERPPPQTQSHPSIKLSSFVNVKETKVDSNLSANAWDFAPPVQDPVGEMNNKLQKRIEELYVKTLCSVCYVKEKNMALIPCGHLFCEDCLASTIVANCPLCRKEYTNKLQIYL